MESARWSSRRLCARATTLASCRQRGLRPPACGPPARGRAAPPSPGQFAGDGKHASGLLTRSLYSTTFAMLLSPAKSECFVQTRLDGAEVRYITRSGLPGFTPLHRSMDIIRQSTPLHITHLINK